jgi:acyl CoA:acetate/3-ketoacid CoA transferase alpha subunit/acyl CoA:acetate/3-ketoacid CoA transferase beta subunit
MATVTDLRTAIADAVQPGDSLHLRGGYQFSFAAVQELVRQYWDEVLDPADRFDLVTISAGTWLGPLVQADAVRQITASFAGQAYPAPGPHPVVRERLADGHLSFEHWTYLTMIERLRAGALAHPFVPTNSLAGSDVGPTDATATVESPFGEDDSVVIPPLSPDVSLTHGVAADSAGNVIGSPVRTEDRWGALASDTVVATVEQVVETDEIRRYGDQTALPSYAVDYVVEAPFGAHPGPLYNPHGVGDVSGYGYDRSFYLDFREASEDADDLTAWTEEWLLDTDWEGYLAQLGDERVRALTSQTWRPGSQRDALDRSPAVPSTADESPVAKERLVVWAAHELADRAAAGDHEVVFGGIGLAHLASWAYHELCDREDRPARPLLIESGVYDYEPPRKDGYIFTPRAVPSAALVDGSAFGLGVVMATASSCSILTGAQIDRQGNVNSSELGGRHFVGSGGANDAMTNSTEVILTVLASPQRLVDEVEFVTGPGDNVSTIVTQYGTMRRRDGEFRIETLHLPPGESGDDRLADFQANVGWDVPVADEVGERDWRPADEALVDEVRQMDPAGDFRL